MQRLLNLQRLSQLCCPESCVSSVHMATSKQSIWCFWKAGRRPWSFTDNIVNLDSLISLWLLSTYWKLQIQIALWPFTFWFEWINQRPIHVAPKIQPTEKSSEDCLPSIQANFIVFQVHVPSEEDILARERNRALQLVFISLSPQPKPSVFRLCQGASLSKPVK